MLNDHFTEQKVIRLRSSVLQEFRGIELKFDLEDPGLWLLEDSRR